MGLFSALFGKTYTNVTIQELKDLLQQKEKYQFVDVRTKQEYKHKHIKGFNKNIDFYKFKRNVTLLDRLDKEKPVVVVCQTGSRSRATCHMMNKLGFKEIYNVKGGMMLYRGPIAK